MFQMKKFLFQGLNLAACTLVTAATIGSAIACSEDGKEGFFPENNQSYPPSRFSDEGISQAQFMSIIKKIETVYTPVFAAQGRTLTVFPRWEDGTVNAYAKRKGTAAEVYMFGGLARHPKMTPDGFMLVICHETGHHLGGAPQTYVGLGSIGFRMWASNEGQSDYFATMKCAREVWKNDDNVTMMSKESVPAAVTASCQKAFDKSEEIALCQRSAIAGQALGNTLASLGGSSDPSFETPDPSTVGYTRSGHPAAQCRLDTYFAGAVCPVSKDIPFSVTDPKVGACSQEKGDVLGVRPTCWYKPSENGRGGTSTWPSGDSALRNRHRG
jgi:hypothetical protein